jgi:cytoskeleton protein RodZ
MDEKETLGKYLKTQRESKKISLREVAKNTRIRETILRAIEEDQHDRLPPETYVKGFLLAYAKYLKLDPNDVLLRYRGGLKEEPVVPSFPPPQKFKEKGPSPPPPKTKQEIPPPEPLKPKQEIKIIQPKKSKRETTPTPPLKRKQKVSWNIKQNWVVGGVILACLIGFYFFSPYSSWPPVEPISQKPAIQEKLPRVPSPPKVATTFVPEEKPVVKEESPLLPSSPVAAKTSLPEKKPLSLQLKAVEETWVNLQVDDQSGKEMLLKPGESISVQASNRIRMTLGNAGGLDLIWNGKSLEKFGKSGEVLTLIFTSQGIEVKRPEKPKPSKEETSDPKAQSSN